MLKQSTARNLMVFLTDSADHVSGKTGATLTITASKNGGAFASITPTVTERGNGWYSVALTTAHTDTLGDLALRATAAGSDPIDLREQVFAALPGESVAVASIANDAITAASIAASAVTELQAGLSTLDAAGVRAALGLAAANLDTQFAAGATAAALATVDTVVDAIKVKTDSLTFTVAGQIDANIQYVNDAQVKGTGQAGNEWGPV
jgi:hypothetical protein